MTELVFIKLGGSLITDKERSYAARLDRIANLCAQLAEFRNNNSIATHHILIGHGSGSFAHTPARQYGTRHGVFDASGWVGFAEVHYQAAALNKFVMDALHIAGIPALSFAPSSSVITDEGKIVTWDISLISRALSEGLVPVVYGDVAFDQARGGTILSTEDLFKHLAMKLLPRRILLAGQEPGVWADFPARTVLLNKITSALYKEIQSGVGFAAGVDVTGGMRSKVLEMLDLAGSLPNLEITIFSAAVPGNLLRLLNGEELGTRIYL